MDKRKMKHAFIMAGVTVAVIAVGVANYVVTMNSSARTETVSATATAETTDVFAEYKEERETTRAQEMSYIDAVAASTEATETEKAQASAKKMKLVDNMDSELVIEGLIATKLGYEAVASISDGSVNVVVNKGELTENEVVQIADIVKGETKEPSSNIKIMPKS